MEGNNNEESNYKIYEIHDGICFLIELSDEILTGLEELDGRSQLFEILSSIDQLIAEIIITSPYTGIGIYFYNCDTVNRKFTSSSSLNKLFKLNDLNSHNMKILRDTLRYLQEDNSSFLQKYPIKKINNADESLPITLSTILSEFHRKQGYHRKKLMWFTNNDSPFESEDSKRRLWKIINDFEENYIQIYPFFLDSFENTKKVKKDFDLKKYQDIFMNTNYLTNRYHNPSAQSTDENESSIIKKEEALYDYFNTVFDGTSSTTSYLSHTTLSAQIRKSILRLKNINRVSFTCNLILSDKAPTGGALGCSIKGYSLFHHERLRKYKKLYTKEEYLKLVHNRTRYFNDANEHELTDIKNGKNDDDNYVVRKGLTLGGDSVFLIDNAQREILKNYNFDHLPAETVDNFQEESLKAEKIEQETEEENDLNELTSPPYLKLLGFKCIESFKSYYSYGFAPFVTADLRNGLGPGESAGGYTNSFTVFSSLYQACKDLEKYALLFGCISSNSLPCLYALYPTGVTGCSIPENQFPEGFFLFKIPWLDDLRSLPESITKYSAAGTTVSHMLTENFKVIISQFFMNNFRPSQFQNPTLAFYYKVMTMELLQLPMSQSDHDILSNDSSARKLEDLKEFLLRSKGRLQMVNDINSTLHKIDSATIPIQEPNKKKFKLDAPELDEEAVLGAWKSGNWKHFTVSQLKAFINKYKGVIKSATRKQDLIDNISSYLDHTFKS